jgi:hypothetical protein
MARAFGPRKRRQLFRMLARRGHPQGRRSIHGLSATPDGSAMIKIIAGSKSCASAI